MEMLHTPVKKFSDFTYHRPDADTFKQEIQETLSRFQKAPDVETQIDCIREIEALRKDFLSMYNIAHIRHTINTRDTFYEEEHAKFDEIMPHFQSIGMQYYQALLDSAFRDELQERFGAHIFTLAELSVKTISEAVLPLMQKANSLSSQYIKLKAKAAIEFEGKTWNLSSIRKLESGPDRSIRHAASKAKWTFFEESQEEIEDIFDQLVKVRHEIATRLGYDNFVQLGYDNLRRADYGPEEVARYRKQIQTYIVPLATKLFERQRQRLELDTLFYYDEDFHFKTGNPTPKGAPEWIIEQAAQMYKQLSPETDRFFQLMQDRELMDLVNRDGKATGGYCTYISKFEAPFIFSNFNGTSADIDVLTHEAGHAFQVYSSGKQPLLEYFWPTFEAAEIHSMSMEFFTWPFMELFFKEETEKYKFSHLEGAITFLPYGAAIDEFQHFVYENPDCGKEARNQAWRDIEAKYLPHRNYDDIDFLKKGTLWQRQSHVFASPFYYIDYTLAQSCALQFWQRDQAGDATAWKDYLTLCQAGGSAPFQELVKTAGLQSPFQPGIVGEIANAVEKWLETTDDSQF